MKRGWSFRGIAGLLVLNSVKEPRKAIRRARAGRREASNYPAVAEGSGNSSACLFLGFAGLLSWEQETRVLFRPCRLSSCTGIYCHCQACHHYKGADQRKAGSICIAGTGGAGGRELNFHWKWQHPLHSRLSRWEKWEKNGDRCPRVNCNLALLQFSITGFSAKPVARVSSLGTEQLRAERGAETAESDHQGAAEPESGSGCCARSIAHPRAKSFWCSLQRIIPNAKHYIRHLQNKWNTETNREWNFCLFYPSSFLFLKHNESGMQTMGNTVF